MFVSLVFRLRKIHGNELAKCMVILLMENFNRGISSIYRKLLKSHLDCTNIMFVFIKDCEIINIS